MVVAPMGPSIADAQQLMIAEYPSMMVAHPMGDHGVPLGLDRPLALFGGGHRLAPSGMPSALGIDHVPGLRQFVAEACRRRSLSGFDGYHQPPLALLGQNGVGKGFVAHWIARNAGVPLFRVPVGADFRNEPSAGQDVERRIPLLPVVAMASARCANPLIVLELDVDKPISDETERTLESMIDPRVNSRWIDRDQQTILDLSQVSWVVEVRGRRFPHGGVRNQDEPPVIEAVLPPRLETLIQAWGAMFRLEATRDVSDLRVLDVAIEVCAASMVTDPEAVADVHAALLEVKKPWPHHSAFGDLVSAAKWALSRHLGTDDLP
ncbi:hypothetical protein KV697_13300 [Sphingomonas sanguinis]|uniref:hypothetical protein n=1 Tax=Sphingomonas sanguinis TaxID=33051 RepID=UPI001C564006|nr:hypothetical protein [Sphingomonas sanguinis]QXT34759.1 hypothetical protein KV697_13300 [Sphingomonas sanguinis]